MLTSTAPLPTGLLLRCLDALGEVELSALSGSDQADLLRLLARAESKMCAIKMKTAGGGREGWYGAGVRGGGHRAVGRVGDERRPGHSPQAGRPCGRAHRADDHRPGAGRRCPDCGARRGDRPCHPAAARNRDRRPAATRSRPPWSSRPRNCPRRRCVEWRDAHWPRSRRTSASVDAHEDQLVADEEAAAREKTRLTLHDNDDGTVTGHFTVPTLHGHLLRKVMETMTAPRRGRLGAAEAQVGANDRPAHRLGPRPRAGVLRGSRAPAHRSPAPQDRRHRRRDHRRGTAARPPQGGRPRHR